MSTSPLKQCYAYGRVSFCVDMHDGCRRGMRRRGKRYRDCCVTQVSPWGGGSLMLWGGISWRHQTPFVVVDSNISARRYNATRYWNLKGFRSCEITLMFYNSRTMPDLKPMQHISDQMGRRVYSRSQPAATPPVTQWRTERHTTASDKTIDSQYATPMPSHNWCQRRTYSILRNVTLILRALWLTGASVTQFWIKCFNCFVIFFIMRS